MKLRARVPLVLIVFLLFAAHFIHLTADHPAALNILCERNWSGAPYTDEGWHGANAISAVLGNGWYIKGDFNEAVMPRCGG